MADATHTERKVCELRVRELADYMAASQQRRRTVLRDVKFRPIARTLQHTEARVFLSNWLREGHGDTSALSKEADRLRGLMVTSDFEASQHVSGAPGPRCGCLAFRAGLGGGGSARRTAQAAALSPGMVG